MFIYVLSCITLLIISVTMLARANDLRWHKNLAWNWNVRLIGFVLSGFAPFAIAGYEWMTRDFPNLYDLLFRTGIMFVFMTTPYHRPWWQFISGKDAPIEPWWGDDRRMKGGGA